MLDWLTARPVAHPGLQDPQKGIIGNTPSAFAAAIAGGYGIECDLQISADGEAMVHHDEALGRLTQGSGRLDAMTACARKRVAFKGTADRMITLDELCALVSGRATLVIELKSRFDGDRCLVARAAEVLARYRGPAALMSFDPAPIAMLLNIAPNLVRGMVAERHYRGHAWDPLPAGTKRAMAAFTHVLQTRPQFIAY